VRRDARQHLLSRLTATPVPGATLLLAGTLLLTGCGSGGAASGAQAPGPRTSAAQTPDPRTPDPQTSDGAPAPDPSAADGSSSLPPLTEGQGRLAQEPAFVDELDQASDAWPDAGAFGGGGYVLAAGEVVDVPYTAPAAALGSLLAVGVTMPSTGAVTLTCDLGTTGEVTLERQAEGGWAVRQTVDGASDELDAGTLDPGQRGEPGEPTALRLVCSDSPEGLAVGVSLHGAGISFVTGTTGAVPAGGPTWRISSTGDADTLLDSVYVYLVGA